MSTVLAERSGVTVTRTGDTVTKAHAPGTDIAALRRRIRLAAHPALTGVLLPPLPPAQVTTWHDGRPATRWPYGAPIDPLADTVPWAEAGTLLARLHALPRPVSPTHPLPPSGAPSRILATMPGTLRALPHTPLTAALERILAASASTLTTRPTSPVALCHGDFHLGQLVLFRGAWHLIDVDDLGMGDPSWDLARPAAWYAAGLLHPDDWARFLHAYRPDWDPWPTVDLPARLMTAHTVARALAHAEETRRPLTPEQEALADAVFRISRLS
ncbi:phosphotransferase [Streptomyces sp. NPDC049881]|uniref:phosphotransferase family protein n=1 Tax=Streptomyces sp. NPDC049881 TaxID=3155778 RepID=UPI00342D4EB8